VSRRKNIVIAGASFRAWGRPWRGHSPGSVATWPLCARRTDRLESLRAELQTAHSGVIVETRELDVNDHDQVFKVFGEFREVLGSIDRVVVNAGVSSGQPVGTGGFAGNLRIIDTNLSAALAQCESAVEIFRRQQAGHLVVVSSMSAMRGLAGMTAYAASKAGAASLAEGIRADLLSTPIKVTTLFPGFIQSEMSGDRRPPMMVPTEKGVRSMVKAIEAERAEAIVPAWPWIPVGFAMRNLPLKAVVKLS
jgi:short-subunit dehydrogenase